MVEFNLWKETFILVLIFSPLIIIPCILVAIIGRKMIDQLGTYPTQTPVIQVKVISKLVVIEAITFACLIGFYQFFTSK